MIESNQSRKELFIVRKRERKEESIIKSTIHILSNVRVFFSSL